MTQRTHKWSLIPIAFTILLTGCASQTSTIDIIRQTERSCPSEWRVDVSHMKGGESREVVDCRRW